MKDPIFNAEQLSRCISCGFCLPACPTYAQTGDEASSPRGRITLMRSLQDGELPLDDPVLKEQASFCLGCRACEPVCPAGVEYGSLLEQWRDHQWQGTRRPWLAAALSFIAARRGLIRLLGTVRGAARGRRRAPHGGRDGQGGQDSLMLGCYERMLFPRVSKAAQSLVPGLSVPARQGCCGALHAHNGDLAAGERLAEQLGRDLPGTIVTTSGGCAAHIASVLGRERVRELSAYLEAQTVQGDVRIQGRRARVTLQDSCHLRNGLGVITEPRTLLSQVADYVELPSAGTCCGAAGTYALLRPKDSRTILDAKLDEIAAAEVDYVVAVNPGCLRQLQTGLRRRRSTVQAVHIADFLLLRE
ncbi:(Fe-S)-binding protein [Streptomyces sp. NPDC005481]|uniref:(Fe-S)-binding protein n=1 Tax=Streptomyces sp. NPDC005481 TaxID=3154881 RepID=UPI0033B87106